MCISTRERLQGRLQRIDHRAVTGARAPVEGHAVETGEKRHGNVSGFAHGLGSRGKEYRQKNAAGAAHAGAERLADEREGRRRIGERHGAVERQEAAGAGCNSRTGVAVAGLGIQPVEFGLQRNQMLAHGGQDLCRSRI